MFRGLTFCKHIDREETEPEPSPLETVALESFLLGSEIGDWALKTSLRVRLLAQAAQAPMVR